MIAVVETPFGNLRSVANAFASIGHEAVITSEPARLAEASHIVLPGVGAFNEGAEHLRAKGLGETLRREVLEKKKPFLGICLGMQLLGSQGHEGGVSKGLTWIRGEVVRMSDAGCGLRLPHVGWNEVTVAAGSRLFEGVSREPHFYFVHSYCFVAEDPAAVSGRCLYGNEFAAAVESGNVFGVQFHPEKSQNDGLRILRNFANL